MYESLKPTFTTDTVESYDFVSAGATYHFIPDGTASIVIGNGILRDHIHVESNLLKGSTLLPLSRSYKSLRCASDVLIIRLKPFYSFTEDFQSFSRELNLLKNHRQDELFCIEESVSQHVQRQNNLASLVNLVLHSKGNISIDAICSEYGISRQALGKVYAKKLGLGFKQLASIWQLNTFITHYSKTNSSSQSSLEAGFFDQAHCIRSFRTHLGITPSQFFKSSPTSIQLVCDKIDKRFSGFFDPV
jgi:AraC-like DNA-binding protein